MRVEAPPIPDVRDEPAAGPPAARRRIPFVAWAVALVTLANSLAWGLIIPPLQVPDEPAHLFYSEYLGETGKLPKASPDKDWYSGEVNGLIYSERMYEVVGNPDERPGTGPLERKSLQSVQRLKDRTGVGDAASATTNPPLYYLPQALVYRVMHAADVTDRLVAMRVVSSLMAALTVLLIVLFLRELLPRSPLAWAVGGLAVGLQPMFAYISSGVNNDAGLYLVSAALFLAVARLLRRGLTARRAAVVAVLLVAGMLVKTQALAYAPGVAAALVVAWWRSRHAVKPWRPLAACVAGGAAPLLLYGVLGATVWDRSPFDRVSEVGGNGVAAAAGRPWQLTEFISYAWQLYLPRLPFMSDLRPLVPPWNLWFKGLVGRFGWLDFGFPGWVYPVALGVFAALVVLAALFVIPAAGAPCSPTSGRSCRSP